MSKLASFDETFEKLVVMSKKERTLRNIMKSRSNSNKILILDGKKLFSIILTSKFSIFLLMNLTENI